MTTRDVVGGYEDRDDPNTPPGIEQAMAAGMGLTPMKDYGDHSWQPVDLTDVLEGRYTPPAATVGARDDGVGLFYPRRLHTIASESEGGKTWLALASTRVELDAGNAAVYLDFEDNEGGVVGRLIALGASRDSIRDRFAYIRPEESIAALGNREDLTEVLRDLMPSVVFLDGVTEAMTLHGLELKDNTDIAKFGRMLPRWIANQGPATVALDHVVKDREQRGRYAIGGVHKLNGVNGAAYVLENRTPFTVGRTGRSTVYVTKDRPGQVRRHALPASGRREWFADLVLTSHNEEFVEVALEPPAEHSENFRPTVLMARVAAALTEHGPLSQRRLMTATRGNSGAKRDALDLLILDGFVSEKSPHMLIKPYTDGAESS